MDWQRILRFSYPRTHPRQIRWVFMVVQSHCEFEILIFLIIEEHYRGVKREWKPLWRA